ncbi:MAG: hypothetical protein DGJ47_000820 [Rickettsiaceae bacterium]
MNYAMSTNDVVVKAHNLIKKHIKNTPLIYSKELSEEIGSKVFLKLDSLQVTGAFKIRGVLNFLLKKQQEGKLPSKIVAYSTGNHAIAMSYAAQMLNIQARVYLPKYTLPFKKDMAKLYGAEIIEVDSRTEAEAMALKDSDNGFNLLHPSDDDDVIAGAGTMCLEALMQLKEQGVAPDAIFAPCGGGGLLAGSYLAKESLSPQSKIYGVEPLKANDAYQSVANKSIFKFLQSPQTSADGLRALSISPRTFRYLQKLDDIILIDENEIAQCNDDVNQSLSRKAEASATIGFAAAAKWSIDNPSKSILILITGGNVSQ